MRIAANEGNIRHIAARIPHPDGAAWGAALGFVRKNVSNNRRINPGSPKNDPAASHGVSTGKI